MNCPVCFARAIHQMASDFEIKVIGFKCGMILAVNCTSSLETPCPKLEQALARRAALSSGQSSG